MRIAVEAAGIVDIDDVLREIQTILEDRLEKQIGGRNDGLLLTVGFVRDLINLSFANLDPTERRRLESVLRTKIL